MKKVKYIARFVSLLVLVFAVSVSPLATPPSLAQTVSLWTAQDPTLTIEGPSQPAKWPPGVFCQEQTIQTSPTGLPPYENVSICTVETAYGEVGGSFLKFGYTQDFIRMNTNMIGGTLAIPNTEAMFVTRASAGQRFMHAYDHPASKIYLQEDAAKREYTTSSATDWTLKNDSNQPIMIREYAVSKNGRWMAIEVSGGIIRFDTVSRRFFKFTNTVPPYGSGKNPELHMAISNDGQYVAVGGVNYGGDLDVYDLTNCVPPPTPNSLTLATGCRSKRLTTFMQNSIPGFNGAFQAEFNGDGTQLRVNTVAGRALLQAFGTTPSYITYIGLGDSFSSGEGTYVYLQGTDGNGEPLEGMDPDKGKCHVSRLGYPSIIASTSGIDDTNAKNIACSGARIVDILSNAKVYRGQEDRLANADDSQLENIKNISLANFFPGYSEQIDFVEKYRPRAITLTIGGNDVGFGNKVVECILYVDTCSYAGDPAQRRGLFEDIRSQFDRLVSTYKKLNEASPTTKIYVLGYPNFMGEATTCEINTTFLTDPAEKTMIKEATSYMNDVIEAAAKKAGAYYINIEDSLGDKTLCSDSEQKAFNGIMFGNEHAAIFGSESFHPNALGYSLMAESALNDIGNIVTHQPCPDSLKVVCPDSSANEAPALPASVASSVKPIYAPVLTQITPTQIVIKDEPIINLDLANLKPGSTVTVEMHSSPTSISSFQADANGNLSEDITIPDSIQSGYHTLHAYAVNMADEKVDLYQHIAILGPEGDLDEDGVNDEVDPCPFVTPSYTDADLDGIDDACDNEISDVTEPTVTGTPDREPNQSGWYNDSVTINWTSLDPDPSSGSPSILLPTLADIEGVNTYTSDESCDPSGNCATGSLELKIDKTAPQINTVWSNNPKLTTETASLNIQLNDALSGISRAEYFMGSNDPGLGSATELTIDNNAATIDLGTDLPAGTYTISIRAVDHAGNWSDLAASELAVNNPPDNQQSPFVSIIVAIKDTFAKIVNTIKTRLHSSHATSVFEAISRILFRY